MRFQQPALQRRGDTMDPWQQRRGILCAALHNVPRVAIAVPGGRTIGLQPIAHHHAALLNGLPDEGGQALARPIDNPLHANASDPVAANFSGHGHQGLVADVPAPSALFDPADKRLINLTGERFPGWPNHRPPQFVQPRPCRLVAANPQQVVEAARTRPILLSNYSPHRLGPESDRFPRVLKDGAGGDRHRGFACATPKEFLRREPRPGAPAGWASEALGPLHLHQISPTGLLCGELVIEFGFRTRGVLYGFQLPSMGVTQVKVIPPCD